MPEKIDLSKPDGALLLREDGTPVTSVDIVFEWAEPEKTSRFARTKKVNVDADCIVFQNREAIEHAGPGHLKALGGAVEHHGDVRRGGDEGERISIRLGAIHEFDNDVDGMALTAHVDKGDFDSVENATCRIFDSSSGEPQHIGNVRVPIQGSHTGVVIAVLTKEHGQWRFRRLQGAGARGNARTWRDLSAIATSNMQPAPR